MKRTSILAITLLSMVFGAFAQLTPQEALLQMKRGTNIGNTFDATPGETSWGNPLIQEYYFDDIANAGFTSVRIPITWQYHVSKNSPYTINEKWMARVDTVVSWGLKRGLFIIINLHHEAGVKATDTVTNAVAKADTLAKYDSIWSQISTHFKDKSDHLLFEILNEPQIMTKASVDSFNVRALKIIRKTNPTRIVIYSGTSYSSLDMLMGARIPDVNDNYLIGYYHSYDPWTFAGEATGTFGTTSDINTMKNRFAQASTWSVNHHIPVLLGECGAIKRCDYNSRMIYYATMVEQALTYNVGFNIWDDNGDFQTYIRSTRKWNDAKDVVIHTYKESPTKLKAVAGLTYVSLSWTNRTTLNDSIFLDRRKSNTDFAPFAVLAPDASQYTDSNLISNTAYYYRLRTNLKDSIDLYSYPVVSKTLINTVLNHTENALFEVYPNPATSDVTVVLDANYKATLDIYNQLGEKIRSFFLSEKNTTISLKEISKGNYIFKIDSEKGSQFRHVVVQ